MSNTEAVFPPSGRDFRPFLPLLRRDIGNSFIAIHVYAIYSILTWRGKWPPRISAMFHHHFEMSHVLPLVSGLFSRHGTRLDFQFLISNVTIQNPIKVHRILGINRKDRKNHSCSFSQNALKQRGSPDGHPPCGNGRRRFVL